MRCANKGVLTIWQFVIVKNKLMTVIDHEFRHNIIKVVS